MNLLDICRLLSVVCVGMRPEDALTRPTGAAIDSRQVKKGNLFFCLPGEHVDGHDFAMAAVENGALAVIANRDPLAEVEKKVPVLLVRNVAAALATIAAAHRWTTKAVVVGITGTSGKTSVKEVLASVLSMAGETAKNPVNLNNQIGLPLSMLNASSDAAYWVMEAGISKPHDMDELASILRPDVALILNAGPGHLQALGDRGVAHYKARLLAYLAPNGQGIVNADYPELVRETEAYPVAPISFSAHNAKETYFASYIGPEGLNGASFRLTLEGESLVVKAPFLGSYGAENVAAVGAVAHTLGLTEFEIAAGFAAAEQPAQRFSLLEKGGFLIIDDSYNANPLSMNRMLEAAAAMRNDREGELILVLGEMGELGPDSPEYHFQLGQQVAALEPGALFWKGGQGEAVFRGLLISGYKGLFTQVPDAASFIGAFRAYGVESGIILFKGSRSNRLEKLVSAFTATNDASGSGEEETVDAV